MNRLFGAPKQQPPAKPQPANVQPPPQQKATLPEKNYDLSETSKRVVVLTYQLFKFLSYRWKVKLKN